MTPDEQVGLAGIGLCIAWLLIDVYLYARKGGYRD